MISINTHSCCGCTACYSICPQRCISMELNNEGFLYPSVDSSRCIDCGLCEQVCPLAQHANTDQTETNAYVAQLKDAEKLKKCASGGFFYAIAEYVIAQKGVVYGAAYDKNNKVYHKKCDNINDLISLCGSKYVQSELGDTFSEIKRLLDSGILVCFSGTGCQVAGLMNYLLKKYDNLITIDLVCAGVPSPLLFEKYILWQEKKHRSKAKDICFRNKTYGYQCSTMRIIFENNSVYSKSGRIDPMMYFFVEGIAKRWCCYSCPSKGIERISDFTIFDSWSADKITHKKTNDKGYTNILVHTAKGNEIITCLDKSLKINAIDINRAIQLDGIMIANQPRIRPERNTFYDVLTNDGIEGCIQKFMHLTIKDSILEMIKPLLYKLQLIKLAKAIRKAIEKTY